MHENTDQNGPVNGNGDFTTLAGGAHGKKANKKAFFCGSEYTANFFDEVRAAGLGLKNTSGMNQCAMLVRLLKHLGPRGINTIEGETCGYLRMAARVQDLEERGWNILSLRENVIGADDLLHKGVARYVLIGRKEEVPLLQLSLNFSGEAGSSHMQDDPPYQAPQHPAAFFSGAT